MSKTVGALVGVSGDIKLELVEFPFYGAYTNAPRYHNVLDLGLPSSCSTCGAEEQDDCPSCEEIKRNGRV